MQFVLLRIAQTIVTVTKVRLSVTVSTFLLFYH